ncbi:transferase family hexapeptide repeat protein, partial [Streptomyces sp. KS 21]
MTTQPKPGGDVSDQRLPEITPGYFIDAAEVEDLYVRGLLSDCTTVFDIKPAMAALLTSGTPLTGGGTIEPGAMVRGDVIVGEGAVIEAGAMVDGPVYVGPGSVIAMGARVRDHSIIGPNCHIGWGAEIARSLLVSDVRMKHVSFVGDSVLGRHVNVGAFVSTTALRVNGGRVTEPATKEITMLLGDRRIGTGQTKFGSVIADDTAVPAGAVLQPGTLIGPGTIL